MVDKIHNNIEPDSPHVEKWRQHLKEKSQEQDAVATSKSISAYVAEKLAEFPHERVPVRKEMTPFDNNQNSAKDSSTVEKMRKEIAQRFFSDKQTK